ncbi:MAG: hypothetical protein ACR2KU_03065 [Gammaproteobacteria bacterium]
MTASTARILAAALASLDRLVQLGGAGPALGRHRHHLASFPTWIDPQYDRLSVA